MTNEHGKSEEELKPGALEDHSPEGLRPRSAELADPPRDEPYRNRLAELAARFTKPAPSTREMKSGERTRGLVILAGASVACLLLFFGVFTTDGGANRKERRTTPNLGRSESTAVSPELANRSPVPQLTVNQQPNDEPNELSEKDLLGTMRNRGTPVPTANPQPAPKQTLASVNFEDPALTEAYRRQGRTPPPRQTEVMNWESDQQPKAVPPAQPPATESLRKSSIVFVRADTSATTPRVRSAILDRKTTGLLPQGTALVARIQHAVSSAAKVPITAVIEYNYENEGRIIVPAGTKAYGELSGATPQGVVNLKFHSLELPTGEREEIDGSALSLDREVLRGSVSGRNSGKKFLTRALTGVGTIAAFAVGGRGLSVGIDNSVLLRERIASNVALAGEQELAMLAFQQNIVVTVPANTRFLLVLHESAVDGPTAGGTGLANPNNSSGSGSAALQQTSTRSGLSEQEARELLQLRNEMREMNRLMQLSSPKAELQPNPN